MSPRPDAPFTLLVNSCDAFSDTWHPFFELLRTHAPGLGTVPCRLVTERREYSHPGFSIESSRANRGTEEKLTWSQALIDALDGLGTDLVLYFQDDYFVDSPVDVDAIMAFASTMIADPSIGRIDLTQFGSSGPFTPTNDPSLWKVGPRAKYRIMTQASLWRKDVLRSYLRPEENGWAFEIFGTRRSYRRSDTFLRLDPARPPVVSYTHTGIIKGRWHPEMPALFARHGIPMEFERRGLYVAPSPLRRRWALFRTLMTSPRRLVQGLRGR